MTFEEARGNLKDLELREFAYNHAAGMLYFDGVTAAPKGTYVSRGKTLSVLNEEIYKLSSSEAAHETLKVLAEHMDELTEPERRLVQLRETARRFRSRVPMDEYVAYQELLNEAATVWREAKSRSDFAMFEPLLQKIVEASRRFAALVEPEKDPYDAQLDQFERGLTRDTCDRFFAALRRDLVPLIEQVQAHADRVDDAPLHRDFPVAIQREFTDFVMGVMDIDRGHCIVGETEHPFTTNFSRDDVRITTNYHADLVASSLYSVVHEGGHALYELHVGRELSRTCLGGGVSMAIHESQSRFYENIIGRSRAFCEVIYPWLREHFAPRLDDVSQDAFYRMINKAQPSLIRTEADELTYCLHIMVRYELEKRMFAGELTAHDLPAEWNRLYKAYLGVDVPNDREGVLQDSHWAGGSIGYFPSYAIGSAYGAQYLLEMQKDFDVFEAVRSGRLTQINRWLEDKIWKYGCMKDPTPLFESVCGPFDPTCYTAYLRDKFTEVYGL